jgi:hypothetical protein
MAEVMRLERGISAETRHTYVLPVVAPCACTSERAARGIKP